MNARFLVVVLVGALTARLMAGPAEEFAAVVAALERADRLATTGKDRQALEEYRQARESLVKFEKIYPDWDPQAVSFRRRYLAERLGDETTRDGNASAAEETELQVLQRRVQLLERSSQQYRSQINQLLAENERLSGRLREALAIRPAAHEPAAVVETQARLDAASQEVAKLKNRVKELETELAGIPKPDEARQNARLLEETRRSLRQAVDDAEVLRKQLADRRESESSVPTKVPDLAGVEAQLQAARVAQSATEIELRRVRGENEKLRNELASRPTFARPGPDPRPAGAALKGVDRARLAMSEGRLDEAGRLLETELAANPESAEGWYLLGSVQLGRGAFEEAAGTLKRALELAPDLGAVHLELARLHQRQTVPDLALSRWHYHRALGKGAPRDPALERAIEWEQPALDRKLPTN